MKQRCSQALNMLQEMQFMKHLSIFKVEVHASRGRY